VTAVTTVIAALTITVCGLGVPHRAEAQVQGSFDLGGASVRYDDSVRITATTLTPRIRFDDAVFAGMAGGTLSSLAGGGWTAQGALDFSLLSPALGLARVEIGAEAGGSLHDDATRTGQYLGRARLHLGSNAVGAWAGGAGGKTWDASLWHRVVQGDFGVWTRVGRLTLVAALAPSSIGDSLHYADAQGALRWETREVEVAFGLGARTGDAIARDSPTVWGNATATLWFTRQLGLVAGAGTYPVDFTQGYPGGRYLSLALRVGARPTGSVFVSRSRGPTVSGASNAGPGLDIAMLPNGLRTIRIHAPEARVVELMGDFTAWQAVALRPGPNGWWAVTIPISPGTYQLNVRVNGGAWDVPVGAIVTVDEFGARVGVVDVR
jgi:hypothetical protein